METKNYIVAIDLGDSNVVVAVGSPADDDKVNIEHIITKPSCGVSAGQIVNIDLAIKSIKAALDELSKTTGIEVKEAYAGISGEFIYCTSHTDHVYVPDHKNGVTRQVVEALFERMSNVMVSEERIIMARIPQRYVINDTTEVDDPVGVFGSPLSSTFNFISSDNIPMSRLDMALTRLGILPKGKLSNAMVVGDSVLSSDEKEEGVAVIDIGGSVTDIAIYHRNILRYISTIPIGAKAINDDIKTLTIPERYIEPLKLKYGCAMASKAPSDLTITIKGRSRHDQRDVIAYNLAAVIEARVRDIIDMVKKEILNSGFANKIPYGLVLTGGSSQLEAIDDLFREATDYEVRVGTPTDVISPQTRTKIQSPASATIVGLLLHGLKQGPCRVTVSKVVETPPTPPPFDPTKLEREKREREERERIERESKESKEQEREKAEQQRAEQQRAQSEKPLDEVKPDKVKAAEELPEESVEESSPKKKHVFGWLDSISSKAAKTIGKINDKFDVDVSDEL